ncbi:Hypothetical protein HDN1F_20650 [gamma proteobacterium HdN1]|nr:Hypothetical protein HDN1F_20650 [gamma proteobacterium HdN1]
MEEEKDPVAQGEKIAELVALEEREFKRFRQGTYADILFVLTPFLAIIVQRMWEGEIDKLLLGKELSLAAAIFAGLSISKFVQGLISHNDFGVYKERVLFMVAVTLFLVLTPAVILTIKLSGPEPVPGVIAYIQPLLLVASITLFISTIKIIKAPEEAEPIPGSIEAEDAENESSPFSADSHRGDHKTYS